MECEIFHAWGLKTLINDVTLNPDKVIAWMKKKEIVNMNMSSGTRIIIDFSKVLTVRFYETKGGD